MYLLSRFDFVQQNLSKNESIWKQFLPQIYMNNVACLGVSGKTQVVRQNSVNASLYVPVTIVDFEVLDRKSNVNASNILYGLSNLIFRIGIFRE